MKSSILDDLKRLAKAQHWTFARTKNNHWKFFSADGKHIIVISGTPSDWRAQRKTYSDFKRAGLIF
jgi:hypothetical protein